jgi:hypothetical protein
VDRLNIVALRMRDSASYEFTRFFRELFPCEIIVSRHYYLARAVYKCIYKDNLIFKW